MTKFSFLKGDFYLMFDYMWDPLTLPLYDQLGKIETEHNWLGVLRWLSGFPYMVISWPNAYEIESIGAK